MSSDLYELHKWQSGEQLLNSLYMLLPLFPLSILFHGHALIISFDCKKLVSGLRKFELSGSLVSSCNVADRNECLPNPWENPCQNNGVCIDGINYYFCNCTSGYHGPHCNIGISCVFTSKVIIRVFHDGG